MKEVELVIDNYNDSNGLVLVLIVCLFFGNE